MRNAAAALVLLALASAAAGQTSAPQASAGLGGKLYKSVFSSGSGALAPADLEAVPAHLRERLERYLARRAGFKSRYKSQPDSIEKMRADAKRRALERSIVALVEEPGIEKAAADFVAAAPVADQWDGRHGGPLEEATFAEDALKNDPASPLAPWFYVFIAERQRIAFEAYENERDEEGMKAAAKKYRTFVGRARAAGDPIYAAIVEDLDRQPYLYLKSTNHPRDYNPDA